MTDGFFLHYASIRITQYQRNHFYQSLALLSLHPSAETPEKYFLSRHCTQSNGLPKSPEKKMTASGHKQKYKKKAL